MSSGFSGKCLCGAVSYQSGADPLVAGHCHCIDCRKSSGTGHCSHIGIPEPAVSISGNVKLYERAADSGNMVGRAFCPECGAAVYSVNSSMPEMIFIRASSLDDPEIFIPQLVVYASRAPSWDHMDPELPSFATMPEGGPQKIIKDGGV
jgi:hypothetical protein